MTLCPGKNQPASLTGGWRRDLAKDLEAIHSWGAQVLVSLMEEQEFSAVGVSPIELSCQVANLGMEWIHAPIVDGMIPDQEFMRQWRSMVPRLLKLLDEGRDVCFHCLGGLGRTGMMAACLLIEAGVAPVVAVAAVRTARPGTIENDRQEAFVINYAPLTSPLPTPRIKG